MQRATTHAVTSVASDAGGTIIRLKDEKPNQIRYYTMLSGLFADARPIQECQTMSSQC